MRESTRVLVLPLCVFSSFLLESFHSDSARGDLDREPKACTHKHTLTCPPVAARHGHILFCQSAAEAADNSCHFTLVPPPTPTPDEIHLFLSPALPVRRHLNLFCLFRFLFPMLSLSYASLAQRTPLPLPIATQQWQTVCTPLGAGGGFYKLNWTQKQPKTQAKKMDLIWMLGLLLKSIFCKHRRRSSIWLRDTGEASGSIIPHPC